MFPTQMIKKPKKILQLCPYYYHQLGKKQKPSYSDHGDANNLKESLLLGELADKKCPQRAVPKGFLAVYVGPEQRRFVIPMAYLSMPDFRVLMDSVAEEYGYEQEGALELPCEEEAFQQILLRCVEMQKEKKKS